MERDDFFAALCQQNYERVYKYCIVTLGNRWQAEDVTQEVFVVAYTQQKKLHRHPNPTAFLYQTAKNLCHAQIRHRKRHHAEELNETTGPKSEGDLTELLLQQQEAAIDAEQLAEPVLSSLSAENRRLYEAYYVEGKSMKQIAQEMNLPPSTIRMRYVRLRREIKHKAQELLGSGL